MKRRRTTTVTPKGGQQPKLGACWTLTRPSAFVTRPDLDDWLARHGKLERRRYHDRRQGERRAQAQARRAA